MYEVTINYKTFVLTQEQLLALIEILRDAKLKDRKNEYVNHNVKLEAFTTVRWAGEE